MKRTCRMCKRILVGRADKIYCSLTCKSSYHHRLRATNKPVTEKIDKILHRNRTILLELMGKNRTQIKVSIYQLEKKKFNFNYITNYTINSRGKTYHYVYDFSYMRFSDNEVQIYRKKAKA